MRNGTIHASLGSIQFLPVIRTCVLTGVFAATLGLTQGTAAADQKSQEKEAEELGKTLDPRDRSPVPAPRCVTSLKALADANAPDSITFMQYDDIPELKAGKHSWTDARAACAVLVRAHALWAFRNVASMAKGESTKNREIQHDIIFKNCLKTYDEAIHAGIPPTEPINDSGNDLKGTMQELRDTYCVAGQSKLDAANAEAEGPYRKVLKSDKLRLWIRDTTYFELAGGGNLTPQRLAATNVWFQHGTPEKSCTNGLPVHTLRRFQFNAQHKLVKETVRDFCGRPPDSAWR
jgi:hypothetical protein